MRSKDKVFDRTREIRGEATGSFPGWLSRSPPKIQAHTIPHKSHVSSMDIRKPYMTPTPTHKSDLVHKPDSNNRKLANNRFARRQADLQRNTS